MSNDLCNSAEVVNPKHSLVRIAWVDDSTGALVDGSEESVMLDEALDLLDPPLPLDAEIRRRFLDLCHTYDEQVGKMGLVLHYCGLRLGADDLADLLHGDFPVSRADADEVAAEYCAMRDMPPKSDPVPPDHPIWETRVSELLTLREAIARWNQEHADDVIKIEDLCDEDRQNIDIRATEETDPRARGLLTLREVISKHNAEHPDRTIHDEDLDDELRAEMDVRSFHPIEYHPIDEQQIIADLVKLEPIALARRVKEVAKELGVSATAVREQIKQARAKQQAQEQGQLMREAPTWAPITNLSETPVNGAALVSELTAAIRTFVALDLIAAQVVTIWVLFTWVFEQAAETNPYLRIISATLACGKSTLLKVLKYLVRSGWLLSRLTPSSFTRTLSRERRTLLLDEGDAFLHANEIMRNLLDGASDPDTATVSFSVKSGDDWTPIELDVFVPIAIASIGTLRRMQTVESRSIAIHVKRATRDELRQLSKGRRRELETVLQPLAAKCARWATGNVKKIAGARPEMPDSLSGRDMDKWEPLIAIADTISSECGKQARDAAILAAGSNDSDTESLGVLALRDIKELFDESHADKLTSKAVCDELAKIEGRPWAEYGKEDPKSITQNQLARLLRGFLIKPRTIRLDDERTLKGYYETDFQEAWERYQIVEIVEKKDDPPPYGDLNRNTVTTTRAVGGNDDLPFVTEKQCDGSKNGTFPYAEKGCDGVTVQNALNGHNKEISSAEKAEIDRLAAEDAAPADDKERF